MTASVCVGWLLGGVVADGAGVDFLFVVVLIHSFMNSGL